MRAQSLGDQGPVELLVAKQIGRARAQIHADSRPIDGAVEHAGVGNRLRGRAHADAIAARPAASRQRRRSLVDRVHIDLGGHAAAIALRVEQRRRPDAALAGQHPPPAFLARRAERRDQADSGDGDARRHERVTACSSPAGAASVFAARYADSAATACRSPALLVAASTAGMN